MTGSADDLELDVLLPVHNEAETIARTVEEIYQVVSRVAKMRFIVSEDGSSDGTPGVLKELAANYPMQLITGATRKGYSRAVIDGFHLIEAPYVLCLDSDGQCDPRDFAKFWSQRNTADVLIGWRVNRQDTTLRKGLSGLFKVFYKLLFPVPVHDPSCPFILVPNTVVKVVLPRLGVLSVGFWWEFVARVRAAGHSIAEIPVNHRPRAAGKTQVYRYRKMLGIGWSHATGLVRIWMEYR